MIQVLFKLVLLCWNLEQVSSCVNRLREESQFPTALIEPH